LSHHYSLVMKWMKFIHHHFKFIIDKILFHHYSLFMKWMKFIHHFVPFPCIIIIIFKKFVYRKKVHWMLTLVKTFVKAFHKLPPQKCKIEIAIMFNLTNIYLLRNEGSLLVFFCLSHWNLPTHHTFGKYKCTKMVSQCLNMWCSSYWILNKFFIENSIKWN